MRPSAVAPLLLLALLAGCPRSRPKYASVDDARAAALSARDAALAARDARDPTPRARRPSARPTRSPRPRR